MAPDINTPDMRALNSCCLQTLSTSSSSMSSLGCHWFVTQIATWPPDFNSTLKCHTQMLAELRLAGCKSHVESATARVPSPNIWPSSMMRQLSAGRQNARIVEYGHRPPCNAAPLTMPMILRQSEPQPMYITVVACVVCCLLYERLNTFLFFESCYALNDFHTFFFFST